MDDYISKSLDFGVRIIELTKWLKEEGKQFPLSNRLLECGTGLGVSLRMAKALNDKGCCDLALRQAEETQYILELMVKVCFITGLQSEQLLQKCAELKNQIRILLGTSYGMRDGSGKKSKTWK